MQIRTKVSEMLFNIVDIFPQEQKIPITRVEARKLGQTPGYYAKGSQFPKGLVEAK